VGAVLQKRAVIASASGSASADSDSLAGSYRLKVTLALAVLQVDASTSTCEENGVQKIAIVQICMMPRRGLAETGQGRLSWMLSSLPLLHRAGAAQCDG